MRPAAAIGSAWLLVAAAAAAQTAPGNLGDLPSGPGVIRGRVVHASEPAAAADRPVDLYALSASGLPGLRSDRTDESGGFAFEGLSVDPRTVYLVVTNHAGVPFATRIVFGEGEVERSAELRISEPTDAAEPVSLGEVRVRVERNEAGCRHLRIRETHELRNSGDRVVFVPEERRAAASPVFRAPLPATAVGFESSAASFHSGLEVRDHEALFWGPAYPGIQQLEFSWALLEPAERVVVSRRLPAGAERVLVWSRDPVSGANLAPAAADPAKPAGVKTWTGGPIDPGGSLDLTLELPPASDRPSPLSVEQVRVMMEVDDALLKVDELHRVSVSGDSALEAETEQPWLCIPLPRGAEDLRLGTESLGLGPAADPSGALAVHGPLPPGESSVRLAYRVRVDRMPIAFERRFALEVPLVSVFVADTGLLVSSERLHRRRPVRTSDLGYAHLEGFQVEAGEPVEVSLVPLPAPAGLARSVRAGFVVAAGAAAALFLVAPLRGRRPSPGAEQPAESETSLEREGLYAAIEDLDHDLETGKLDPRDHARLRDDLRARAARLLRQEREAARAQPSAACPQCGASRLPGARFCAQCGVRLADGEAGSAG